MLVIICSLVCVYFVSFVYHLCIMCVQFVYCVHWFVYIVAEHSVAAQLKTAVAHLANPTAPPPNPKSFVASKLIAKAKKLGQDIPPAAQAVLDEQSKRGNIIHLHE